MKNDNVLKISKNRQKNAAEKQKIMTPLPIIRALFLALIMRNPCITGYEILKIVPETINVSLKMKTGTLYTELRRLEEFGFVESSQSAEGRKRRHYEITTKGIKELNDIYFQIQSRIQFLLEPLLELINSILTDVTT